MHTYTPMEQPTVWGLMCKFLDDYSLNCCYFILIIVMLCLIVISLNEVNIERFQPHLIIPPGIPSTSSLCTIIFRVASSFWKNKTDKKYQTAKLYQRPMKMNTSEKLLSRDNDSTKRPQNKIIKQSVLTMVDLR